MLVKDETEILPHQSRHSLVLYTAVFSVSIRRYSLFFLPLFVVLSRGRDIDFLGLDWGTFGYIVLSVAMANKLAKMVDGAILELNNFVGDHASPALLAALQNIQTCVVVNIPFVEKIVLEIIDSVYYNLM